MVSRRRRVAPHLIALQLCMQPSDRRDVNSVVRKSWTGTKDPLQHSKSGHSWRLFQRLKRVRLVRCTPVSSFPWERMPSYSS
jgi:hypothetical protein